MTSKRLTGNYPSGYTLSAGYTELIVEKAAYVGGSGVTSTHYANIINNGLINGASAAGVSLAAGGGVANAGTIEGKYNGVSLMLGGEVTNGSATQLTASISGSDFAILGINGPSPVVVHNYGSMRGGYGILIFTPSGAVTNGSPADVSALIYGTNSGIEIGYSSSNSFEEVNNFGTIKGDGVFGIYMGPEGDITNGSSVDTTADIEGRSGLVIGNRYPISFQTTSAITNFGTISGSYGAVNVPHGGILINGSASDHTALIIGVSYGVTIGGGFPVTTASTVTNFGTIAAAAGQSSVHLGTRYDRLVAEAGSMFIGVVVGGGGTLELGSGAGTVTGLGATGIVSGAMALSFTHFDAYELDSGGSWTMTGANTLSASDFLNLDAGATMTIAGAGAVSAGGTATQDGLVTLGNHTKGPATLSILGTGVWYLGADIERGSAGVDEVMVDGTMIQNQSAAMNNVAVYVIDDGVVEVAAGVLELANRVSGTGTLKIDASATLTIDRSVSKKLFAQFDGSDATLALGDPAQFSARIEGFASTDAIHLLGKAATSAVLGRNDTLIVSNGSTLVATFHLSGSYAGDQFSVTADGAGGSIVTLAGASSSAAFVNAMASEGTGSAGSAIISLFAQNDSGRPQLIAPRSLHG